MTQQSLHHIAKTGFADASAYDKHRPTYSAHETNLILSRTLLGSGITRENEKATLVDLAAGTGLFTEALVAASDLAAGGHHGESGFDIVAVEPHDQMRQELENKALPGVRVVKGWASDLPIESGSVDVVFATQAFHWFANLEALKEIRRVLKPSGYLALIWHVDDWNSYKSEPSTSAWEAMVKAHIWEHDDNVPRYRHKKWKDVFDDKEQTYFETPIQEEREPTDNWSSVEALWARLNTYSIFSTADRDALKEFKKKFEETLKSAPKNEAGEVLVHGKTHYFWTKAL